MSAEKPEALRLADELDAYHTRSCHKEAAAELRRLHAEVERLSLDSIHSCHAECQRPVCRLTRERDALLERADTLQRWYDQQLDRLAAVEAQRDALLEALRTLFFYANTLEMRLDADGEHRAMQQARAAIAKAEGEQA